MDISAYDQRLFRLSLDPAKGTHTFTLIPEPAPTPSPSPVPRGTDVREIAWGKRVDQDFIDSVCWIADELKFDVNWLMACIAFETGRTFSPKVKNPLSSATGLVQMMEFTAAALGTTTSKLALMTAVQQLGYVYRYLEKQVETFGPIKSLADCYMAIFAPSAIGKPLEHPLYVDGKGRAYLVNKGLDVDKDGRITKLEAANKVYALLEEGRQPANLWKGEVQTEREIV